MVALSAFMGLSVLCGIGGVLGLAGQRVGEIRPAGDADAVVMLLMVALLLLAVDPRGLGSGAHGAVRGTAVAQTAATEGAGQVRAHGRMRVAKKATAFLTV